MYTSASQYHIVSPENSYFGLEVEPSTFSLIYGEMSAHGSASPQLQQEGNSLFPEPMIADISTPFLSMSTHQSSSLYEIYIL